MQAPPELHVVTADEAQHRKPHLPISQGAQAIVANGHIVTKVYFPRALLPAASVASALIDFLLGLPALVLLMVYYRSPIDLLGLAVFLLAFALVTLLCLGLALWFAAMWAFWRDVGYLLPFLLQLGMFASPIIYPISVVPPAWRAVYALNPFISAIGAARWAFAGGPAVPVELLAISAVTALVAGWGGYAYFRRRETFFSDKV
jgi:lipopolysaccharide transport system permease protein